MNRKGKLIFFMGVICQALITLLLSSACREETKAMEAEQKQRLAHLRQQLQQELGDEYDLPVPAAHDSQLQRGAKLYIQVCAPCHGGRGDAKGHNSGAVLGTPSDLTDPQNARFFSEQARIHIIRKGSPGTAMLGWEKVLPEEDIVSLYLYIRSLIRE